MKKILFSVSFLLVLIAVPVSVTATFVTQNIAPRTLPRNAVRVPVLKLLVPASDQSRTLKSVDLELSGLIDKDDISRVWVENSAGQRSFSRSFGADYRVNLPFRSTQIIPAGQESELYVLVNLNATTSRSFQINVTNIEFEVVNAEKNSTGYQPFQSENYRSNSYFSTARYPRRTDTVKKFRLVCKNSKCQLLKPDY